MPNIHEDHQPVTQITVVESEPGMQGDALVLMIERARFMARQPGFISISLHRSKDGRRIVNYVQWQSRELLQSAHHSPEFRAEWRHFDELTREIEPQLYEVALVMDGQERRAGSADTSRKHARSAGSRKAARTKRAPQRKAARRSVH
jgi:heme-degrading monooxygenase HmoA